MKGYLINVREGTAGVCEITGADGQETKGSLQDYYRLIGCRCVDIASRSIGGKYFDLVVDDEGLYGDNATVSAVDGDGEPMLVGNIVIVNCPNDESDGYMRGLEDEDIALIKKHVRSALVPADGRAIKVLVGCEY